MEEYKIFCRPFREGDLFREGDRVLVTPKSLGLDFPSKSYAATVLGYDSNERWSHYVCLEWDDNPMVNSLPLFPAAIGHDNYHIELLDERVKEELGPGFESAIEEELKKVRDLNIPEDMVAVRRTALLTLRNLTGYTEKRKKYERSRKRKAKKKRI